MDIERIASMEQRLDRTLSAVGALESALEQYSSTMDDIAALEAYLGSPEWLCDRKADEAGQLPQDMKRGVLSEDAIWNLLERNRELRTEMKHITQTR